jgi:ATP-dependent Lon protease
VTVLTAMASLLTGRPVRDDVAMTGEITLRGRVLPIGGIKEKVLGAHRAGLRRVLLPRRNEADLDDIPADLRKEMQLVLIESIDEVLREALTPPVAANGANGAAGAGARAAKSVRGRPAQLSHRAVKARSRRAG